MKTTLERLPKSRVRLSVQVPQTVVQKAVEEAYHKLGEQVEVKGFRKGQAPKGMIFETVGISRVRETILEKLLPDTYFAAIQEEKLVPVQGPQVNIQSAEWEKELSAGKASSELHYHAEVDILPAVELTKDYKKLRIENREQGSAEVTDEEVNGVIDHLRRQQAHFKEVDRPAKDGDRVEITFEGTVDHVSRPEFSSKNYPIILGTKTLLPDFEKEIVGMRKGGKKSFTLSMPRKPARPGDNPAEKEKVEFTVSLHDVKEVILPELTDEFAKKVGQDSTLALRGAIRASLKKSKEDRERAQKEQQIADALITSSNVEVPESLVHQEIHRMLDTLKAQATGYGMPWEVYLAQLKKSEQELHDELAGQAAKTVKFGLILGYIITKEGLDPKDKEAGRKAMDRLLGYATRD